MPTSETGKRDKQTARGRAAAAAARPLGHAGRPPHEKAETAPGRRRGGDRSDEKAEKAPGRRRGGHRSDECPDTAPERRVRGVRALKNQ
eukprot:5251452-Prymnesium_polylepis.1